MSTIPCVGLQNHKPTRTCTCTHTHTHTHTDDHSCVELSLVDGNEGSDYINASWIDVSIDPNIGVTIDTVCCRISGRQEHTLLHKVSMQYMIQFARYN